MDKKKNIKPKSAKNNNNNIIGIKNIRNNSTNIKAVKKIKNIAKNINQKPNIYSSNSIKNIKTGFELEYDKLENLCNKKSTRNKLEIENFIADQKRKIKRDKRERKDKHDRLYKKMFRNYQKLEREIKNINIVNKLKKKEKAKGKKDYYNLNDKSNGSIENNKFENKYYFGCLDVKRILSKRIISDKK